ncbi:TetR/AcrR family transcriptional regulator [Jatrophihabitans endophyticus]|uniref:TetR/AcrR family transcriptional regulator n=1 Tax=Jatrophihabitans endophyticus TaxID=1206085 RepID=UPI0019E38092|nr:TetR/AcrR family transcriptional regulator [Jatrophihabitans endophyticus]MBE7188283.1 TetR family transcriptional regulator [Jatrophihabitans endophyticus]
MPDEQDELTRDAAVFARLFADADDLTGYSYAARRVLAMSAALFHRDGAAATSVRDITAACGLSPGALYKHFASKDDLLDVLVAHGHHRSETRVAAALAAAPPDIVARVAAFVRAYVLGHLENPQLAQLVRREYLHLSPDRRAAVVTRRRRMRSQLAELLRAGDESRVLDLVEGADATGVAVMILDMCSRTSEWYHAGRAGSPADLAERYVVAALRLSGAPAPDRTTKPAATVGG